MIAGYASIHSLYHDAHKATLVLAWTATVSICSPMIGPVLGSNVLLLWEWRAIFWILTLALFIPFAGLCMILPESLLPEEKHSLHPIALGRTYRRLLTTRGYFARCLALALYCSGLVLWITTSPYIVMHLYHYSPQAFGYLQVPVFAAFIVGAQSVRFFLRFLSRERLISLAMSLSVLGALFMLLSSLVFSQTLYPLLGGVVLYALGVGLASAPLNKETILATSEGKGMSTSLLLFTMTGFYTLVSLLISILPDTPLIVSSITTSIIILTLVCFRCRNPLSDLNQ